MYPLILNLVEVSFFSYLVIFRIFIVCFLNYQRHVKGCISWTHTFAESFFLALETKSNVIVMWMLSGDEIFDILCVNLMTDLTFSTMYENLSN